MRQREKMNGETQKWICAKSCFKCVDIPERHTLEQECIYLEPDANPMPGGYSSRLRTRDVRRHPVRRRLSTAFMLPL